jgi:ketosteroid isomerase-like protein
MSTTTESITALLAEYNDALNASSTDAVMSLYTERWRVHASLQLLGYWIGCGPRGI